MTSPAHSQRSTEGNQLCASTKLLALSNRYLQLHKTMGLFFLPPLHFIMLYFSLFSERNGRRAAVVRLREFFRFFFSHYFYFPASSGQAVVTGVVPSSPRFLPSIFIAHRVQQSHCSSICHRVLLTHALAFSASQFVHKKKSPRIYTSMHSGGFELTKLTHTAVRVPASAPPSAAAP